MRQVCLRLTTVSPVTTILFVGDIVAKAGRQTLRGLLPGLRDEFGLDFVVVNGENAAERVRIVRAVEHAAGDLEADEVEVSLHAPALAAAVPEIPARSEAQLLDGAPALAADGGFAVGVVGHRHREVDAVEGERRALHPRLELPPAVGVEDVDLRRA